jgi:hypothetical protein
MDNLNFIKHFRRECNCELRTMAIPIIKQGVGIGHMEETHHT